MKVKNDHRSKFSNLSISKKKPEKKKSGLHFHFVYCKGNKIIVDEVDVDTNTGIFT